MAAPWPLGGASTPALYVVLTGSTRGNVYLDGEQPTFTFDKAFTGTWTVRDYYGTVMATGNLVAANGVAPTRVGGWPRGWYRLYLTDGTSRPDFGNSLGVTNFSVIADDNRFVRPTRSGAMSFGGEFPDYALKGFLGIGTSRNIINNAADPDNVASEDRLSNVVANIGISNTYWTTGVSHHGPDTARPREQYVVFGNEANDHLLIDGKLIFAYKSGAVAAAGNVSIVVAAGTSTGRKYTLTQGATVETYDNVGTTVADAMVAMAGSNLVAAYRYDDQSPAGVVATGSGTLTNARYLGVKTVVQTCYPLGVTWYEGPVNEPDIRKNPVRYANDTRLFHDAVKAGNASAKVMGPSIVDINPDLATDATNLELQVSGGSGWLYRWLMGYQNSPVSSAVAASPSAYAAATLAVDGPPVAAKNYLDGIMVHVYNFMIADPYSATQVLDEFERLLTAASVADLPRWQGELGVITPVYGVYHPRRGRLQMLHHLMLERYGMPRERNNLWYDLSHGFWDFPGWWENTDQSLNPHAVLLRVLAEETYGRPFEEAMDFGPVGNRAIVGNSYLSPADGTRSLVFVCASHVDNQTVTLRLTGTVPANVTWRDGFGKATVAAVTDGQVTVPLTGEPTYVALPAGCVATVVGFLGLSNREITDMAGRNAWGTFDGVLGSRKPLDGHGQGAYDGGTSFYASTPSPANYTIKLERSQTVTDVLIFSGMAWQSQHTLLDFDVQTSANGGSSWTTRATVTKTATSMLHGSTFVNTGTQRDTFWDEQWIFPVALPAPVVCNAVRIVVRATSLGGEPDAAAITTGGQGNATQTVVLTDVMLLGDPPPRVAAHP